MINLNAKERMLLEDEKAHEELCVKKYQDYAKKVEDPALQTLFNELSQKEQQHLDSINQMLNGTVPNVNQQQGQQQAQQQPQQSMSSLTNNSGQSMINVGNMSANPQITSTYNDHDKLLCQDALSTEKYVSSTYNTAIFEFKDKNIRQVLNHIQKEEQEHGEKIYNYMSQHGMYNA